MILKVEGQTIGFFNSYNVTLSYNTVGSTFTFSLYFDPQNSNHKLLLHPLKYKICTVEHNGELLITGRILSHSFKDSPQRQLVSIGGYSLTGVLEDCEIPISVPLQLQGVNIVQIAQRILKPFGLGVKVDGNVSSDVTFVHKSTTAERNESIVAYLSSLASQINVIVSHTPKGELLLTRANTVQKPVMDFERSIPGLEITHNINGQQMHSEITVVRQIESDGGNAGQSTVKNPFVDIYRPCVKVQTSGNDISTLKAAKNVLANEIKSIGVTIDIDRWTLQEKIIRPNMMVTVTDAEVYLYNKVRFFVDSVTLSKDEKSETATLECLLPCVYDGTPPVNIYK